MLKGLIKKIFNNKKDFFVPLPPGILLLKDNKRVDEYCWYYKRFDRKDEAPLFHYKHKDVAILDAWKHYWYFEANDKDLISAAKIFGVKNGKSK